AMADCYLRALLTLHPFEPVHLLGHSFGGWIAFEMATRLRAAGRTVESLTMVDTEAPDAEGRLIKHCNHMEIIRKWLEIFEMITERSLGLSVEKLIELPEADQLSLVHERLVDFGLLPSKSIPGLLRGPLHNFANAMRACFTPKSTYSGRVR